MLYKEENEKGSIIIEKAVIARIIMEVVSQFNGKVFISNYKNKATTFYAKIGVTDEINSMDITMGDQGLDIKIYIVVKFGTSIKMVTNKLITDINNKIIEFTMMKPNSVSVVVTGMISKNIAKRNIEVKR
ncbi:Asp23/Gls24 family envelope stress response protein [Clostridium aminobutyricum]|uniref:Asp23/Gls24 family envelope stress response protein n=1 Tax=Clostridium aminobutyricum TaxID=33953 RepID=A0A939IGU9_CLOAM|nr:Asp23/Gls24 family envelope stress response protein [Clostridium aminobutyricum]MBN7772572.1 Asp23/Gls24 family envelope stress response protein [Clostridium aminobutyricum]